LRHRPDAGGSHAEGTIVYIAAPTTGSSGSALSSILLLVAMGLLFYFILLRPVKRRQQAQQQQAAQMRSNLGEGDQIVTHSGLYGTVVAMDDESVTLEISPGVTARYVRDAIAKVVTEAPRDEFDDDATDEDEDADATDAATSPAALDDREELDKTANTIIEKRD
jgi:preprotein translocase subunit YajC